MKIKERYIEKLAKHNRKLRELRNAEKREKAKIKRTYERLSKYER